MEQIFNQCSNYKGKRNDDGGGAGEYSELCNKFLLCGNVLELYKNKKLQEGYYLQTFNRNYKMKLLETFYRKETH